MTSSQLPRLAVLPQPAARIAATNAKAAAEILATAARLNLPEPITVSYGTHRLDVAFHMESLADLTEWAKYLDAPIVEGTFPGHRSVEATLFDHNVYLYTLIASAVPSC